MQYVCSAVSFFSCLVLTLCMICMYVCMSVFNIQRRIWRRRRRKRKKIMRKEQLEAVAVENKRIP